MNRSIILFLVLTIGLSLRLSAQDLDAKADSAFSTGDYAAAAGMYEKFIKDNGSSAALYYNLGNCYYRMGKLAKAVTAYERSLRLDPANDAAKANLEFTNSKLIDKKGYEGSFLSRTFHDITNIMSANAWAWTALILFAVTIAAIAVYLFGNSLILRKTGFFGGGITAILCIIGIIFAFNARKLMLAKDVAIVSVPSSILSTTPRAPQNRNEEAMLLHEGAKVKILDSISSPTDSLKTVWYDVSFDNDHRAWINSNDVEII